MNPSRQIYLAYWRQLKLFVDEQGLDWTFSSFEGESQAVVKIGSPKHKICLSLNAAEGRNPRPSISAAFWIPDSHESFDWLKAKRVELEAAMEKPLQWDSKPGRKSCWIRVTASMDLSNEKDWPASFEWFAENAGKIRDVCHQGLA